MREPEFTPAAGHAALTPVYDFALRVLTRERRWREALLEQIAPRDGQAILDVGCGTGTLAVMLKRRAPGTRVIGLDPDPAVLAIAAAKAQRAGVEIEWRRGFARDAGGFGEFDHIVSTLVFHQAPPEEKLAGLRAMFSSVRPGGHVHIADYCRQPDWLMRQLFRIIQTVDGKTNTQANVDGAIEEILSSLSEAQAVPRTIVRTPTGAISLFRVRKGVER
jgi:ubiquinone/menaquinone biosynthesis C-methylase UbiE